MSLASAALVLAALAAPAPATDAFDQIVSSATAQNHPQACARMQGWIDAHPGDAQVPRALLWMAQLERADHRGDLARPLLQRAAREGAGTEWALHAQKALADLDLEAHRYGAAIATYDALARRSEPLWRFVGQSAADDARGQRARFRVLLALLAAMAALAISRLVRSGARALWPPPFELVAVLPLLGLLLVAAIAQEPPEAHAVITLALGSVPLLWLNGAWLRARPPRGLVARLWLLSLGLLQAAALLYATLVWNGLWLKLMDTLAMGAE